MTQKDQTTPNESQQEQRSSGTSEREARREEARAAFSEQGRPEVGGTRDTMMNAVARTEQLGTGVVGGVGNVASGVIGVVRDTANTAIDGVGSVGQHAVHALTGLLVEVVGGVRQVAGAAVGGVRSTAQEAFRRSDASQEQDYGDAYRAQEVRRDQPYRHEPAPTEQPSVH